MSVLCIYKDEIGENNPDSVPDSEPSQLDLEPDIATAQTAVVATSAAFSLPHLTATTSTTTLGKPAARKRRQSEFEAQSSKSMECIQSLIKARLEKTPEDEDDVFGKMVAWCSSLFCSLVSSLLPLNSDFLSLSLYFLLKILHLSV